MKTLIRAALLLALSAAAVAADGVEVLAVEMASGFETTSGKLIAAGDQLVFVDETSPQYSFFVTRSQVANLREENGALVVTLNTPVRDRQGERTSLAFRYSSPEAASALLSWFNAAPGVASSIGAATSPAQSSMTERAGSAADMNYEVRHKRMFGDTNGKLVITDSLIKYESTDKIEDSRNWALRGIKEVKLKNPYEIEIIPFSGSKYEFVVKGTPITGDDFKKITDRVISARGQSTR